MPWINRWISALPDFDPFLIIWFSDLPDEHAAFRSCHIQATSAL